MRTARTFLTILVMAAVPLAGCISGDNGGFDQSAGGGSGTDPGGTSTPGGPSTTSPGSTGSPSTGNQGQTESRVKVDPNATFLGGAHTHDWWGELKEYVIMDEVVGAEQEHTGLCAGAVLTFACNGGRGFVYFPESPADESLPPNNVWPGTGAVTIEVRIDGTIVHPFDIGVSIPHRGSWNDNLLTVDATEKTFVIENLEENNTDAPHSRSSSWSFRLQTHRGSAAYPMSLYHGEMSWTVTIHRADRSLPVDPPHPDYWGGETHKVLAEATVWYQTRNLVVASQGGYSYANTVPIPDNHTMTIGSGRVDVRIEWDNNESVPTQLALMYCTGQPSSCTSTSAEWLRPDATDQGNNWRSYQIPIRPDQWDSPYSTHTAWKFKWVFDNEVQESGTFDGSVDWRVDLWKAGYAP